jgi:hypothetical protein
MSNPQIDNNVNAAYMRALEKTGQSVIVQRLAGIAPNVTITAATVTALVRNSKPYGMGATQQGYGSGQMGGITQTSWDVILMATGLAAQNLPLPPRKGDKVILSSTGEKLNVINVDTGKLGLAGAILLTAVGVE